MAKAAILMPYPDLKDLFGSLVRHYPRLNIMTVEYVATGQIAERASVLEKEGCELIIARGLQARYVRTSVVIPVIEMRASTQELEALVLELKQKVVSEPGQLPRLGLIGFFNMFHNTEQFNDLFGIDLRVYTVTEIDQYAEAVNQAAADGCLGVIGGEVVQKQARVHGLASVFLSMGEESAREALTSASLVGYSIDQLKRSTAEINAMLDNTNLALLQVDETGTIRLANRLFYQMIGKNPANLVGINVKEVIPDLALNELDDALKNAREIDASVVTLGHRNALMSITPVLVEERVSGAILTFQESQRITEMDSTLRIEIARQRLVAESTFDQLYAENSEFQKVISQLKRLSRYSAPVLLKGESGTGKGMLAQCMHNESLRRDRAFVTLDCSVSHPDDLDEKLFGRYASRKGSDLSAVELARGGTLYLRQVELLSLETQYKILLLTRGQYLSNDTNLGIPIDIKLIISTESNLRQKMLEGTFRNDLYYALNALRIDIPPLRDRREDIPLWFENMLTSHCRTYGRHIHLTREAVNALASFDWPGNLNQMSSLCDRLVLLSEKRNITEDMVLMHLQAITSEQMPSSEVQEERILNARAQELLDLLNRYHGNREKAAAELGISKTTLWRRMKKYGIARDLSIG